MHVVDHFLDTRDFQEDRLERGWGCFDTRDFVGDRLKCGRGCRGCRGCFDTRDFREDRLKHGRGCLEPSQSFLPSQNFLHVSPVNLVLAGQF